MTTSLTATPGFTWEAFGARVAHLEPFLPETGGNLSLLVRDLAAVDRLGIPRDRRLLGVDLSNLAEGIDRISAIRQHGQDTQELAQAAMDLMRLAMDMRVRAAKTLRNESQEIAIHASVAAMASPQDHAPIDLSQTFRLLASAPAPSDSDRPGMLLDTGFAAGCFGRLSGMFYTVKSATPLASAAAPIDAVILPMGSVACFEPGETLRLFSHGLGGGDRFREPKKSEDLLEYLVEAGPDGLVLHGPAVIGRSDMPAGTLSGLARTVGEITRFTDVRDAPHNQPVAGGVMLGWAATGVFPAALAAGAVIPGYAGLAVGATMVASVGAWGLGAWSAQKRAAKQAALPLFPQNLRNGQFQRLLASLRPDLNTKELGDIENGADLPDTIKSLVQVNRDFNALPATRIAAEPGQGLPVMVPLAALPAPAAA